MKCFIAASLFLISIVIAAKADDPPPVPKAVQPKIAQPKAVQPAQPGGLGAQPGGWSTTTRVSAATLARYEEEAEILDAQLDVKKAYIRAAEVGFVGAKLKLDRVVKFEASKAITPEEVSSAKLEVDAAGAQLEIRMAEAKEVAVKLKHAKKRIEDGKAAAAARGPARPPIDPKPIDPMP